MTTPSQIIVPDENGKLCDNYGTPVEELPDDMWLIQEMLKRESGVSDGC